MDLNIIWFILVGILFTGYAVLDGFDLGVGSLHLLSRTDEDRRKFLNSIGPVWDGNEVWLVTGGGALFAAFPEAYATVLSGFYLAFMGLLCCLIFRAVAIEFRSKEKWGWWRSMWDVAFSISSITAAFLIGVAMGNIVMGIPLASDHEFAGTFMGLLNPYALFLGVTTVFLFAMHGSIYLVMKNEGETQAMVRRWVRPIIGIYLACFIILNLMTVIYLPHIYEIVQQRPWIMAVAVITVLLVLNVPREFSKGREFFAFLSSCAAMVGLMALFGMSHFPYVVLSMPNPEHSLDIYNAASSQKTLGIMLIIAIMGLPLVMAYTVCIYWIFRGKVQLEKHSY